MSAATTIQTTETTQNNQWSNSVPVSPTLPTKSDVKILSQAENGDLYLKVFLLGGGYNKNKWGIDPSTVEENIKTAIGKPLIIYKDTGEEPDRIRMTPYGPVGEWKRVKGMYNHPPWDKHSIEHSKEIQKAFSVGQIEAYAKNNKTGDYWGVVKITDNDLKEVFKQNPNSPFYVSPQLWRLNMDQIHTLRDWEFMHLAIVSQPAFGVRATVQGSCEGDVETCVSRFANASLAHLPRDESGTPKGCGFCIKNAMKEIAEQTLETEKIHSGDTSHLTNSTNLETEERLSDNRDTQNAVNAGIPNATTLSENVVPNGRTVETTERNNNITVEHKTYPNPETRTYRPNANPPQAEVATSAPSADKLALIARIEQEKARRKEALQKINVLARDNQELATKATQYEKQLAEVQRYIQAQQIAAREDGIAQVVYNANLADLVPEEKKEAAIKLALSKGLEPEEVAAFLSPIYEAFDNYMASQKQNGNFNTEQVPQINSTIPATVPANASLNRNNSRLRLGAGNNNNSGNAYNASLNKPVAYVSSEPAFMRVRKLAGMYTPEDTQEVQS